MHSNIPTFMSVLVRSSSLDWVWLYRIVALVFALYDTMCYDYEHGASDTCNATDVFLARQVSQYRYSVWDVLFDRCQ